MSQSNESESNLRRSSRIATTNSSTATQSTVGTTLGGKVTTRRSSASQEPTVAPAKITRAKRLSLSQESSDDRPGTPKVTSRSARSESKSPTFDKVSTPSRGRKKASVKTIEEEEVKVSTPASATSRRRSSRGQSTSPSLDKPELKPSGRRASVTLEPIEESDASEKVNAKKPTRTRRNSNSSNLSDTSENGKKLVVDLVRLDTKRLTRRSFRGSSNSPTRQEEEEENATKKKKMPELNTIAETSLTENDEEEKTENNKGDNWERDTTKRLSRSPAKKDDNVKESPKPVPIQSPQSTEKPKVNLLSLKKVASPKVIPTTDTLEDLKESTDLKFKKRNSTSTSSEINEAKDEKPNTDDLKTEKRTSIRLSTGKNEDIQKGDHSSLNKESSISDDLKTEKRTSLRLSAGKIQDNDKIEESVAEKESSMEDLKTDECKTISLMLKKCSSDDSDIKKRNSSEESEELNEKNIADEIEKDSEEEQDKGKSDNSPIEKRKSLGLSENIDTENQNKNEEKKDKSHKNEEKSEESDIDLSLKESDSSDEVFDDSYNIPKLSYDSTINETTTKKDSDGNLKKGSVEDDLEVEGTEISEVAEKKETQEATTTLNKVDLKKNLLERRKSTSFSGETADPDESLQKRNLSLTLSSIENIKDSPITKQVEEAMQVQKDQKSSSIPLKVKTPNRKVTPLKSKEFEILSGSDGSFQLNMSLPSVSQNLCDEKQVLNSSNNSDKENLPVTKELQPKVTELDKTSTPKPVNKNNEFYESMEVDYASDDNADKTNLEKDEIENETNILKSADESLSKEEIKCDGEEEEEEELCTSPVKKMKPKVSSIDLCNSFVDELDEEIKSEEDVKKNDKQNLPKSKINSKTPNKKECTPKSKKNLSDNELDLKLDALIKESLQNYDSEEEEDEIDENSFICGEAEEGEEDTPSEGSNDIIEEGESLHSTDEEIDNDYDEDYDNSFIDDDNEDCLDLLSGDEFDLGDKKKVRKSRIIQIEDSSDDEIVSNKDKSNQPLKKEETEIKESNRGMTPKKLDSSNPKEIFNNALRVSPIKKKSPESEVKDDSTKPEIVLNSDEESTEVTEETLPTTDKMVEENLNNSDDVLCIEEKSDTPVKSCKNKVTVLQEIKIVPSNQESKMEKSIPQIVINDEDNLSSLEALKSSFLEPEEANRDKTVCKSDDLNETATPYNTPSINTSKRKSSINIQENIDLTELTPGEITEKISKAVGFFCSSIKEKSGNISLNVSLDFDDDVSEDSKKIVETIKPTVSPKRKFSEISESLENKTKNENKKRKSGDDKSLVKNQNRFSLEYEEPKQKTIEVNRFLGTSDTKNIKLKRVKDDKISKRSKKPENKPKQIEPKKSKNKQKQIESPKETLKNKKREIQDEFEVEEDDAKLTKVNKKRKGSKTLLTIPKKKQKSIEYFSTKVLQELDPIPSTSEITPKKVKKPKSTQNYMKPSSPDSDDCSWNIEEMCPVKPSKNNKTIESLAQFVAKDFKNRMMFDPTRNKRMQSAKMLKNKRK